MGRSWKVHSCVGKVLEAPYSPQVNLNTIKRCLLVSYDSDTQLLHLRHYSVKVVPVGLSRGLKKLLQEKFPNMNRMEDIRT